MAAGMVMVLVATTAVMVQGLFLRPDEAGAFLGRVRRANDKGLLKLEERRQGDLERECVEESCSHEEAREVFENVPETEYFYPRYQECSRKLGAAPRSDDDAKRIFKGCVRALPNQCSPPPCRAESSSGCVDLQGDFACRCLPGWTGKTCSEVWSECVELRCEQGCSESAGSVRCYCEGRNGSTLAADQRSCQPIHTCAPVSDQKDPTFFYLGMNFNKGPAIFMRFKLQKLTRPMSTFELRTFDPEGLVFYGETGGHSNWFLLALHNGQLEVQMKDTNGKLVTTGGKPVNDGQWHQVSVEKTLSHVIVKVDGEEVINVNNPGHISNGVDPNSELEISVAGLPPSAPDMLRPMNVRLDGCIRNWDWMGQDTAWISGALRDEPSRQCYRNVEPGSFLPGAGHAEFNTLSYAVRKPSAVGPSAEGDADGDGWRLQLRLELRPSRDQAVLVALVRNGTDAELTVALTHAARGAVGTPARQQQLVPGVGVFVRKELVLFQEAPSDGARGPRAGGLCDGAWHSLGLSATATSMRLELDGVGHSKDGWASVGALAEGGRRPVAALLTGAVRTCLGGLPDTVAFTAAPISAYYAGCLRGIRVGGRALDLHEADHLHPGIRSHSCLPPLP
ncbi:vitamin K-dependent protein S-like isoform X2 [Petromyzon marinus]|uniref:vitamin K-dependent protein S-like isoform X2 n=1 Tax=Petromyzon marinus TaxID=7757 RepID=UPI003F72AA40